MVRGKDFLSAGKVTAEKNKVVGKKPIMSSAAKRAVSAEAKRSVDCTIKKAASFAKHAKRGKISQEDINLANKYPC